LAHKKLLTLPLILLFTLFIIPDSDAQTPGYEILPSPDLWYNDVDGILLGLQLKGQVPGTFEDGPHRLDAGIWLGLWFPKLPVSYHITYTEPIQRWSDYGSEANVQALSSIRTGYHNHGIGINKRWQRGFDERRYIEIGNYNSFEKRFDDEYTAFPVLWSDRDKYLSSFNVAMQNDNRFGWYQISADTKFQFNEDFYTVFSLTANQRIIFNDYWGVRLRGFLGAASSDVDPEYRYSRSMRPASQWMGNRFTRAKGTIPQSWIEGGNIQIAGGPNLRGYTSKDVKSFIPESCVECENITIPLLYRSFAAANIEVDYWNPVAKAFNEIPYASEFLSFRSYLFFDAGRSLHSESSFPIEIEEGFAEERIFEDSSGFYSNAGAGFSLSLNIPDYHGKPRGFVFRYEIPFWLSDPGEDDSFSFRHLIGFGATISF